MECPVKCGVREPTAQMQAAGDGFKAICGVDQTSASLWVVDDGRPLQLNVWYDKATGKAWVGMFRPGEANAVELRTFDLNGG